jgi:hypothetical protein
VFRWSMVEGRGSAATDGRYQRLKKIIKANQISEDSFSI